MHRRIGDATRAEALDRRAVDVLAKSGDRRSEGRARANLGSLLVATGRTQEGIASLEQALAIALAVGDPRGAVEVVALTLGHHGGLLVTRRQAVYAPTLPVEPVSAVGAGDSFLGAMLWSLGAGQGIFRRDSGDSLARPQGGA